MKRTSLGWRRVSDVEAGAHLLGDDVGEGGLAESGGAVEEQVLDGLASVSGGLDGDADAFDELGLADVLVDALGTECDGLRLLLGALP